MMNIRLLFSSKIRNRIISSFVITMLIVIVIFNAFLLGTVRRITTDYIVDSNERMINYTARELEAGFENISAIINSIIVNQDIQEILQKTSGDYPLKEQLEDYSYLDETLFNLESLSDFGASFYLAVNPGFYYSREAFHIFPLGEVIMGIDSAKVIDEKGATSWTLAEDLNSGERSLVGARAIININDFTQFTSVIYYSIPLEDIARILALASYDGNNVYLVMGDESVSSTNSLSPTSDVDHIIEHTSQNLVISQDILEGAFTLVSVLDATEISAAVFDYRVITVVIGLLIFAVSIALSFAVTKSIIRRVGEIEDNISLSYDNNFTPIPVSKDDELSFIEKYYNDLAYRIRNLIQKTFEQGKDLQRSRYNALRAQINPHFLYNTLNTINLLAMKYEADEISAMISDLADFYKLSLNNGRETASIKDEIQLCRTYLRLQQRRFSFPLELLVRYEDQSDENIQIVNLILQPLVENAILHGIIGKQRKHGVVSISIRKDNGYLVIQVEDNGIGCSCEKLEPLLTTAPASTEGGYGLRNINMRLKLYYGAGSGLAFSHSDEFGGLSVQVRIANHD